MPVDSRCCLFHSIECSSDWKFVSHLNKNWTGCCSRTSKNSGSLPRDRCCRTKQRSVAPRCFRVQAHEPLYLPVYIFQGLTPVRLLSFFDRSHDLV